MTEEITSDKLRHNEIKYFTFEALNKENKKKSSKKKIVEESDEEEDRNDIDELIQQQQKSMLEKSDANTAKSKRILQLILENRHGS